MTKLYTIELEFPRAIKVQGGSWWRRVVGLGDPPCVAKVNFTVSLSTRTRALELTIPQAQALIMVLQAAVGEAEQITEQRNQQLAANQTSPGEGGPEGAPA